MRIREAGPTAVPAMVQTGHDTWPQTYAYAGADYVRHGLSTWWSVEAVERSLLTTTVLIADDDTGRPIATANVDLRGEAAIIWKLYVLPHAQGTGVGSALLSELLARAGDKPTRLAYADGNEHAAAFYAAHGFRSLRRDPSDQPGWPGSVWLERPIDKISGR